MIYECDYIENYRDHCTKSATKRIATRIRDSHGLEVDIPIYRCDEHYKELLGTLAEHDDYTSICIENI